MEFTRQLLEALIVSASQLSGYHIPAAELTVKPVDKETMSALACRGRVNCPVMALYQDHDIIFIRSDLTEAGTEHVLVHEIVHWMQHHSGKFFLNDYCPDNAARENEAYHVQNRYIAEVQHGFSFHQAPKYTCEET